MYVYLTRDFGLKAPKGEMPSPRYDYILIAPIVAILTTTITLLYYYKFKRMQTPTLEKYFSYFLFVGISIAYVYTLAQRPV